jgi:hypothetical protein
LVTLRAFSALFAGFVAAAVLQLVLAALFRRSAPDWDDAERTPGSGVLIVHLGGAFLAAAAGGYVTAWGATGNPLAFVLALSVVLLVLSGLSVLQERGNQPVWFLLAQVALSPLGAVVGGLVRLRATGVLP